MNEPAPDHRAGVVALLGRPNVGKSTLMNRLVGEELAIVTPKPQTTRSRILGILSLDHAQLLLQDTPGLHEGEKPLDVVMREAAHEAGADCDVAVLLVDPVRGWEPIHAEWLARIRAAGKACVVAATRIDHPAAAAAPWPPPEAEGATAVLRVSARSGEGLDALLETIVDHLPVSPPYYDRDTLTDRPMRFLAAECVRAAAFRELAEEVPYGVAVEIVSFDESDPDITRIAAKLLVERQSQKRIAVGTGGERVRAIGTRARKDIEKLLDGRVYLELWVKADPQWRKRPKRLKSLGYY